MTARKKAQRQKRFGQATPRQSIEIAPNGARGAGDSYRQMMIEWQPIDSLALDRQNPRVHSPRQVRQIARSMETFGFNFPILVDSRLKVLAGHGRVLAASMLGRTEISEGHNEL